MLQVRWEWNKLCNSLSTFKGGAFFITAETVPNVSNRNLTLEEIGKSLQATRENNEG